MNPIVFLDMQRRGDADPFLMAVRDALALVDKPLFAGLSVQSGKLPSQQAAAPADTLTDPELKLAFAFGSLLGDAKTDPADPNFNADVFNAAAAYGGDKPNLDRRLGEMLAAADRRVEANVWAHAGAPVGPVPPPVRAAAHAQGVPIVFGDMRDQEKNDNPNPAALYKAVRSTLKQISGQFDLEVTGGKFPSQIAGGPAPDPKHKLLAPELAFAAVFGLLEVDNIIDPTLSRFVPAVTSALGEYTKDKELFDNVFDVVLANSAATPDERVVRADQWAAVARAVRTQGIGPDDAYLSVYADDALAGVLGTGTGAQPSAVAINLPNLEEQSDLEIVENNIRGMQAVYFAAMLEELKLFQVTDKLVEMFHSGMLPLGRSNAGDGLYRYWKKSIERLSEIERRNLYARTFGFPGGESSVQNPNREFNDLWLRFVSAVVAYKRQITVEYLLSSGGNVLLVTQEQLRKAGMDLAGNLSLHGYSVAYFVGVELQTQINDIIKLLSDPDIKIAYGARDMWQVVDQVATLELGGAKNSVRSRTLANSGAVIIAWLASHAQQLSGAQPGAEIINAENIRKRLPGPPRPAANPPLVKPLDYDLTDACEQWLAVTGTQEKSVEEYSQPIDSPATTSRPVQIPQIARDLLQSVGVSAGYTNGRSH